MAPRSLVGRGFSFSRATHAVGFARVADEQVGLGLLLVGHADKASLSEMVIACEGIGERELPHHNETSGID